MLSGTSSTISITVKSLLFSSLHFYVVSYPRRSSLNKNAPIHITTIVLVSVTGCIFYILDLSIACISYSNIHDSISLLFLRQFSPLLVTSLRQSHPLYQLTPFCNNSTLVCSITSTDCTRYFPLPSYNLGGVWVLIKLSKTALKLLSPFLYIVTTCYSRS